MEDLLQPQIVESCQIAMPEGLRDLMSDISREVLRAQPKDILKFITNYLYCLLISRENLRMANKVYSNICSHLCFDGLESELEILDINKEDIEIIKEVIEKHFNIKETVNETSILSELIRKTSINEEQLPLIQEAIRKTFIKRYLETVTPPNTSKMDDVGRAINHTLHIHDITGPLRPCCHQDVARSQITYEDYESGHEIDSTKEFVDNPNIVAPMESRNFKGLWQDDNQDDTFEDLCLYDADFHKEQKGSSLLPKNSESEVFTDDNDNVEFIPEEIVQTNNYESEDSIDVELIDDDEDVKAIYEIDYENATEF